MCLIAALLAACTSTPEPTITLIPSQTPTSSDTPLPVTTAPTGTLVQVPTLPPEWTAIPSPTLMRTTPAPTNTFTPTIDPNPTLLAQPTLAACATFGIDLLLSQPTFTIGTNPTVYWTRAEGALTYRLALRDDQSNLIFSITAGGASYTFEARLFELGRNYSWEVRPLDVSGRQMCVSRGSVLTPVVQ